MDAAAIGGEPIPGERRGNGARRAIIDDIGPQPRLRGAAFAGNEHRHRRVVGVELGGLQPFFADAADDGIEQMRRLTRELEARDEPIVLVLFGDHKPWMGNGSSVYAEMGVDLDVSTQEGFYNYFSTPYLIYANKAARESLGQDFRGDGGDISPCFLMDKLFFECGWTGDGFMQLQRETRAVTPLMHEDGYRMVDGSITLDVPPDVAEICRRYLCAQYYREQHFVSES